MGVLPPNSHRRRSPPRAARAVFTSLWLCGLVVNCRETTPHPSRAASVEAPLPSLHEPSLTTRRGSPDATSGVVTKAPRPRALDLSFGDLCGVFEDDSAACLYSRDPDADQPLLLLRSKGPVSGFFSAKDTLCLRYADGASGCHRFGDADPLCSRKELAQPGWLDAKANLLGTCALRPDGDVLWQEPSASGSGASTPAPSATRFALNARALTAGPEHFCALGRAGEVWCWGKNDTGALGTGSLVDRPTPALVSLPLPALSVAAGELHTCALLADQSVRCWGHNHYGQVGTGELPPWGEGVSPDEAAPMRYPEPHSVALEVATERLVAADSFSCALGVDALLRCWGGGLAARQLSGESNRLAFPTPTRMGPHVPLVDVVTDGGSLCVLTQAGATQCWGPACGKLGGRGAHPCTISWQAPAATSWPHQRTAACPDLR